MAVAHHGPVHELAPARPESIAPLRHAVVGFAARCGAPARRREDIAVAVSEALTNAVLHAYPPEQPGVVEVQAWMEDGLLEVAVCDEGGGMRPRFPSPGMGAGLALIARFTEHARFEDAVPGVRVRMTFSLR